ncbi:hypothetical protein [Streptosporangium sp. KLBMP 9127]|nr:hypothetical protein [Streptosporangium sp. KLBMP 9127]
MNPNRKMWISAGVVGVVLVGGFTVAAAASSGRLDTVSQETRTVVTPGPEDSPAEPKTTPTPEDYVVSEKINPKPGKVGEHWTPDRLEEAEPMPMPAVTFSKKSD